MSAPTRLIFNIMFSDDEQRTTWLHPDTGQPAITGFYNSAGKDLMIFLLVPPYVDANDYNKYLWKQSLQKFKSKQ